MKDQINPDHYKQYPVEVIDMMIRIWGPEAATQYCIMTAFKYRMRLGHKDSMEQEIKKEKWYLSKAASLEKLIDTADGISRNVGSYAKELNSSNVCNKTYTLIENAEFGNSICRDCGCKISAHEINYPKQVSSINLDAIKPCTYKVLASVKAEKGDQICTNCGYKFSEHQTLEI